MRRYESYRTRRVPISINAITLGSSTPMAPIVSAGWRLDALRELMRMEMPDTWWDIVNQDGSWALPAGTNSNSSFVLTGALTHRPVMATPSLWLAYQRRFLAICTANSNNGVQTVPSGGADLQIYTPGANTALPANYQYYTPTCKYQGAECLYMIVTCGSSDELNDADLFRATEIGDVDQDGAPEFIDGWGMPIQFLRWAPGFFSELQTHTSPDPFDTRFVYPSVNGPLVNGVPSYTARSAPALYPATNSTNYSASPNQSTTQTFALYPLIFSGGPDKADGINKPSSLSTSLPGVGYVYYNNDPFASMYVGASPTNPVVPYGTPYDSAGVYNEIGGTAESVDNIHNHLMGTK